ncbi:Ste24 endopeptidase [Powellomyces hirtus]|uniref:CAAX prenyl protease n=1 Tax=Powellomyces hirtus TaxID=109895 RepID=A0A507DV06_9FUNG|nr:Ste24 endopeptidase [Powellomyces hirtus]
MTASDVPVLADGTPYKEYVLAFSWAVYLWATYLNYRQHVALRNPYIPPSMSKVIDQKESDKARAYGLDKSRFSFFTDAFEQLQNTAFIHWDILPLFWNWAGQVIIRAGYGLEYEITQSIVFVALMSISGMIFNLPFSIYRTFVIEQRHGFNKTTPKLFVMDMIKETTLSAVIGIPLIAAFLKIIDWAGQDFYFYVWVFMLVVQLVMILIFPTLIQPLFNTFTPLPEGSLRDKINALATRINFPLKKLFVIDGSKRSAHSNAYFYGFFGNKRIVLYDTLLEQSTEDEVCGVLAHELGHWQYNHVLHSLVIVQLHLFSLFYLFSVFVNHVPLYRSFGFMTQPPLIGFTLFQYVILPVETIIQFLMNMVSRRNEFQADAFAKGLGYAALLKSALIKLHVENKGTLNPDKWYSAWHYSHPPLVERLEAIGKTE